MSLLGTPGENNYYDCCSGDPVPGNPRNEFPNEWKTGMFEAPCNDPCWCLLGCFCPCPAAYFLRDTVLENQPDRYKCCQGYYDCDPCWKAGNLGEKNCPQFCNCLEAFLCYGLHVSSSRASVMDTRQIKPDRCDNRLIGFNNCCLLLRCICDCLALLDRDNFKDAADCLHLISEIVSCTLASCMIAQIHHEVTNNPVEPDWSKENIYARGGVEMHKKANYESIPEAKNTMKDA